MSPPSSTPQLDRLDAAFESEQTASQASLVGVTALTILLLAAQHSAHAQTAFAGTSIRLRNFHQASAQTVTAVRIGDAEVLHALLEFHDRLVSVQEELSPEASEVLYRNLWRLYD